MGRYQGFKFQKLIATRVPVVHAMSEAENEQKHAIAVAAATIAAANAMAMAAQATATMIQLTPATMGRPSVVEEATNKIQAVFGFYLARKALCAWKGLVKLQALVKGHMVRKEATATNGCMQALVPVQARARAQRIRLAAEAQPITIGNCFTENTHRTTSSNKHIMQDSC